MARGNAVLNWFRKYAPCFTSGESDRTSRSGDSSTSRSGDSRTNLRSVTTGSSRGGGDVASSSRGGGDVDDSCDKGLWSYCDLKEHRTEEYSWARFKLGWCSLSSPPVDIKLLPSGMYVGLYNGHGSSQLCSHFLSRVLFKYSIEEAKGRTIEAGLSQAFIRTDEEWLKEVTDEVKDKPLAAAAGSSTLVGVIGPKYFYFANVGDSRAVLSTIDEFEGIRAYQLTREDNVNDPEVRAEVLEKHQNEPDFMTIDSEGVYRIKGRSQLSKALGDAYLKSQKCNIDENPEYRLTSPIANGKELLSATPFTGRTLIKSNHNCVIFASREFWDVFTNSQVAQLVHVNQRKGIAETLIRLALTRVAEKNQMTYEQFINVAKEGNGNPIQMAVAVVFFAKEGSARRTSTEEEMFFDCLVEPSDSENQRRD